MPAVEMLNRSSLSPPVPQTSSIRPATPADVDAIGDLIVELAEYEELRHEVEWRDPGALRGHLFGADAVAHVDLAVESDGDGTAEEVVGLALWFWTFSTFLGRPGIWLEDLYVRPAHRGAGHGRALLTELMRRSPGRVEWAVLDWNEPSIGFYRSLGAEPVDGWTRYRWTSPRNPEGP